MWKRKRPPPHRNRLRHGDEFVAVVLALADGTEMARQPDSTSTPTRQAGQRTRPGLLVCGGAPRRNRTGDPILTMDRRATAMLSSVFAGPLD